MIVVGFGERGSINNKPWKENTGHLHLIHNFFLLKNKACDTQFFHIIILFSVLFLFS